MYTNLTIRTKNFNLVAKQPGLLMRLRKLTLSSRSGLNFELNRMLKDAELRKVNCKILLAYKFRTLVAWGILSKEDSDFVFPKSLNGFKSGNGRMFQVFVNPNYRRQGIASKIYKKARQIAGDETIFISPWDARSTGFFGRITDTNTKLL